MEITEQQQRFVDEYLIDLNATMAAIRAGYSPKTAQEQSSRLLSKVMIKDSVDRAIAERSKRTGVNQDRIVQELAKIAFADMGTFVSWNENGITLLASDGLEESDTASVQEITEVEVVTDEYTKKNTKLKLHDKQAALEKLGKHLGMFTASSIPIDVKVHIIDNVPNNGNKTKQVNST